MNNQWNHKIFEVKGQDFESLAIEVFHFQYSNNPLYRSYVDALHVVPQEVTSVVKIPFLPISFFKSGSVQTTSFIPEIVFESSGTTQMTPSRHLVKDLSIYKESFTRGFEMFYGPASGYCVLGLLPSYLERKGSSLVLMVDELIRQSSHPQSGFYLNEWEILYHTLLQLQQEQQQVLLIGVTFGLLDFAEKYALPLSNTIIMETGGMKGRRKEMIREEVHSVLKERFSITSIHSEYGMTELLSQAYSKGNGIFETPPWMKVLVRDDEDPLLVKTEGAGVINVIDLANIYSCSFIATEDAGRVYTNGSFEVLGRIDNSDLRGCSLMVL
ncbi:MAG: acyl transferase [Bacteroidetes bacterium]|nr:acyl transferase [Bacteroidota bacterium]